MKKVFNLENYKGKYVMHCNTYEKAEIFLKFLDSKGRKWCIEDSYLLASCWDHYEAGTCYAFNEGKYSDIKYWMTECYTILEFDNFKWGEEKVKATLTVDGKEIEVEISEEELKKLVPKKTGYERVGYEEYFWIASDNGIAYRVEELKNYSSTEAYEGANYYTDERLARDCARADKLLRQLRRFAVEHREEEFDWVNKEQHKYMIFYDHECNKLEAYPNEAMESLTQYFDSIKTAELAIETFKDELIWYFTEFKDSL